MMIAQNREHLDTLIKAAIKKNGPTCNLNFIDVSRITDMSGLFRNSNFNGDISEWNVSNVTNMEYMFSDTPFNGDLSKWNVSDTAKTDLMFARTPLASTNTFPRWYHPLINAGESIKANNENIRRLISKAIMEYGPNCDLNFIDVSQVTDMSFLFRRDDTFTPDFNGDISKWNVSNVKYMQSMFWGSTFNGDISKWNVSNVTSMNNMFCGSCFNGDISKWNVSNVTDMSDMFCNSKFNGNLGRWNVSKVRNLERAFSHSIVNNSIGKWKLNNRCSIARIFDNATLSENGEAKRWLRKQGHRIINKSKKVGGQIVAKNSKHLENLITAMTAIYGNECDLNVIDVSRITCMSALFSNSQFNGDISRWNVSNVKHMQYMFCNSRFNGDISKWDVSNVIDMSNMFCNSQFNGDISEWNVSNVTNMDDMFKASQFSGDISKWDTSKVKPMRHYRHHIPAYTNDNNQLDDFDSNFIEFSNF